MKLSQLKFFCTVVEHKTIAAAARELHCVPSNVTLRLRELEETLGGELFFRDKNRLYVNPKGRLFYQQARDIVAQAERSKQLFAGEHQHGLLNLGALDSRWSAICRRASPGCAVYNPICRSTCSAAIHWCWSAC